MKYSLQCQQCVCPWKFNTVMLLYSRFNQYMYNSVPVEDTLWSNSINNVLNHAVVDLYHAVLSFYNPAASIHNNTYETGHIT